MYSDRLSFFFNDGHCTKKLSAKYVKIFPVRENDLVRQKLSTNTILVSVINAALRRKARAQIGMQVPGPLHKISSGLSFSTRGMLYRIEYIVVKMDVT